VLALKLAELEHLREVLGEAPLLLLDDVASELDEERRRSLFEAMAALSCQSLITVTERDHLPRYLVALTTRSAEGRCGVARSSNEPARFSFTPRIPGAM